MGVGRGSGHWTAAMEWAAAVGVAALGEGAGAVGVGVAWVWAWAGRWGGGSREGAPEQIWRGCVGFV